MSREEGHQLRGDGWREGGRVEVNVWGAPGHHAIVITLTEEKRKIKSCVECKILFYHFLNRNSRKVASSATSNCAMAFVS